jgi:hypothetical protein
MISAGIWAFGMMIFTLALKIALPIFTGEFTLEPRPSPTPQPAPAPGPSGSSAPAAVHQASARVVPQH